MKKILSLIFLLILIPNLLWAAAFTSKATGNWTSEGATTWNEAGHPGNGDTVSIANGHTVTLDASHDIGTTTLEGALVITGVTATASGALTLGNGTNKTGTLTGGASGILAMGGYNIVLNNCVINLNGTSRNTPFKITFDNTFGFTNGAVLTSQAQDIDLNYVTIVWASGSGPINWRCGTTGTGITSDLNVQNTVIYGASTIAIGHGGYTPAARNYSITDSDIYASGIIQTTSIGGDANTTFSRNTFYSLSGYQNLKLLNRNNATFTNNVFIDYYLWLSGTGGNTVSGNFFYTPNATGGTGDILIDGSKAADTLSNNYHYGTLHLHILTATLTGGTGSESITGSVFDYSVATDMDAIVITGRDVAITKNVVLNAGGDLWGADTISDTTTLILNRNTSYTTGAGRILYAQESNSVQGPINIVNNLLVRSSGTTDYFALNLDGVDVITIAYMGYNQRMNTTNLAGGGAGITVTSSVGNLATTTGKFVDTSRKLATWNQRFGSGTNSATDAVTYLLAINGYRGTPNFDQGGTVSVNKPSSAVEWVKYGFSPTDGLLREAGDVTYAIDGSQTIGAMQWQNPRRKRAM